MESVPENSCFYDLGSGHWACHPLLNSPKLDGPGRKEGSQKTCFFRPESQKFPEKSTNSRIPRMAKVPNTAQNTIFSSILSAGGHFYALFYTLASSFGVYLVFLLISGGKWPKWGIPENTVLGSGKAATVAYVR